MKIAVLSGKGGTGKTLVSVNLATAAKNSVYIDCDIEEPNGFLFFKPEAVETEKVTLKIPSVDKELCSGCRKCVDFCKFNALAYSNNGLIVFDQVCHSCGGCAMLCPVNAIHEKDKEIGQIQKGNSENVTVLSGSLKIGEASGVPIINKLLTNIPQNKEHIFIDCPPGSACTVMESIKDADYCIMVVEPTIFGVHNFNMVYELVKLFNKPHGVVLNKCTEDRNPAEEFCKEKGIKILEKIPFDSELGKLNSNGKIVARENDKYLTLFSSILEKVTKEVAG